jgi:hypothetical protein
MELSRPATFSPVDGLQREMEANWTTGILYDDLLGVSLSVALIQKYAGEVSAGPFATGGIARARLNHVLDYIHENSHLPFCKAVSRGHGRLAAPLSDESAAPAGQGASSPGHQDNGGNRRRDWLFRCRSFCPRLSQIRGRKSYGVEAKQLTTGQELRFWQERSTEQQEMVIPHFVLR